MKYLFFGFMLLLLASCDTTTSNNDQKAKKSTIKLESFINTFLDSNKNWNQNDIIRDKTNEKFKTQLETALKQGLLEDFPLELGEIKEYSKGKFAANFQSHYNKRTIDYNSILYGVKFDVIGLIDEKFVATLKEDKAYLIKGRFKRFLRSDFKDYINGMVYTPLVGFTSETLGPETSMGVILMDIEQVTETKKL
jgi:hypothetical protein